MKETEKQMLSSEQRKEKIRKRYRSVNENVRVIPAREKLGIYQDTAYKRVAVYARVSTDNEEQTSSFELQKSYYEDLVQNHDNWELIGIYADEGISGTSLNHRDEFVRMIQDCEDGKIDLIITKSVSRFARNVEDCIHYVKKLRKLKNPVGILFETEGIYSLADNSEMQLAFSATMAQEESHVRSESMNRSYRMRYKRGLFLTPTLLGYDHDEDGDLIINYDEAKTIQLMFWMFLTGSTLTEIADKLMDLKRHTKVKKKSGEVNYNWTASTVRAILQNEKYCGDVLAQKTFTPDYLDHKSVKNVYDLPQYYAEDHHDAIISREMYVTTQRLLEQNKFGFRNMLPELTVIHLGALKGFVQFNPRWLGFTLQDYIMACHSVLTDEDYLNPEIIIRQKAGDLDFRKYQVVRSQFIANTDKISVSISHKYIRFSNSAIEEFVREQYVELLFHPFYEILIVRKSKRSEKHSVQWATYCQERLRSKKINGSSFLPILYEMCDWNPQYRYTLTGYVKEQNGEKVLLFYADEPEIRMVDGNRQAVAYPKEWIHNFGDYYLNHQAKTESVFHPDSDWQLYEKGIVSYQPDFCNPLDFELQEDLHKLIHELTSDMQYQKELYEENKENSNYDGRTDEIG